LSFLRPERPIAMGSAMVTPCTKSPNTRRVKKARQLKVEDVMIENNQAMEDKPSPSSERRPKLPKRSPSDYSATNARGEDVSSSPEPRQSY
jgi:hypothetical protein